MTVYRLGGWVPTIHASAYVSPHAVIIGDVEIREGASIWPGAILRADNDKITVGAHSNVQDGAVIHTDPGFPTTIGDRVSIGHQAMLHGCTIADDCLIGIQAVILDAALISATSLVGASALVPEGRSYPPGSMIFGSPAKLIRALSAEEILTIAAAATVYATRAQLYMRDLERIA